MNLKERIQYLCNQNGVSVNKLEQELGFGKGYISKLGKSKPNTAKAKQIADYFDVPIDYLLGEDDNNAYYTNIETAKVAQEIFENEDLRLLFDAAKDAAPEDLKMAHDLLMRMKRSETHEDDMGC